MSGTPIPIEEDTPQAPPPVDVPDWIITDRGMMDQNKLLRSVSVLYAGDVVLAEIETWCDDTGAVVNRVDKTRARD